MSNHNVIVSIGPILHGVQQLSHMVALVYIGLCPRKARIALRKYESDAIELSAELSANAKL